MAKRPGTNDRSQATPPDIDRTAIRYLLAMTPEERLRSAMEDARRLRMFDLAVKANKGR